MSTTTQTRPNVEMFEGGGHEREPLKVPSPNNDGPASVSVAEEHTEQAGETSAPAPKPKPNAQGGLKPPRPTGRMYGGIPVPSWFKESSAEVFRELPVRPDDVLLLSFPKAGTTWLWKIVQCLLYLDDAGAFPDGADFGSQGSQMYFCALGPEKPGPDERAPFGPFSYHDLIDQPSPRMFSTHNPPHLCPKGFETNGKVLYVMRNPKDCLVSLHYMRGVPADGWPGSFSRFTQPKCPNAFGSFWDHVKATEPFMASVGPRGLVVFYENLHTDFDGEVKRLASLLGASLTPAKLAKLKELTHISSMKKKNSLTVRKGKTGGWRSHFSEEQVEFFDGLYSKYGLGDSALFKQLLEAVERSER